jgi:hypothetical protein
MAEENIGSLLRDLAEELGEAQTFIENHKSMISPEQIQEFLKEIQLLQNKIESTKTKIANATKSGRPINYNAKAFINNVRTARNNIASKGGSYRRTYKKTYKRKMRQ